MNFFGTKIQPILYVDVTVYPEYNRSEITVLRAETVGSETALRVNGTFNINAKNIVSAGKYFTVFLPLIMSFFDRDDMIISTLFAAFILIHVRYFY